MHLGIDLLSLSSLHLRQNGAETSVYVPIYLSTNAYIYFLNLFLVHYMAY